MESTIMGEGYPFPTPQLLGVASTLRRYDPPTPDELALVRLFDPRRYFLGQELP
jgi:hypothetical protein